MEETEERPKRPRLYRWWFIVPAPLSAESEHNIMETVREYGNTTRIFIETPRRRPAVQDPKDPVVGATDADVERAFRDLLSVLTVGDRALITADLRQRAGRQPSGRQLDTSPAAVAKARALFGF